MTSKESHPAGDCPDGIDSYQTLVAPFSAELKVQRSRFIAEVAPAATADDAKAFVGTVAGRYHDCRHVCFAWRGGFLKDAIVGLARTATSDYRSLRDELGLAQYGEAEMIELLRDYDFAAERRPDNIGHNQARMTFLARPA